MGFPVDIKVTDLSGPTPLCLSDLQGVTFGEIIGPLALPNPGMYQVDIFAANAITPCSGDVVLTKNVQLTSGMGSASSCIQGLMSGWRFGIPKDSDGEATDASFSIALILTL